MAEDEGVEIEEGMPVADEAGTSAGKVAALLIPEDEEEAEFIVIETPEGDRLLPFDAVIEIEAGQLVLDLSAEDVRRFPKIARGSDPTDAHVELAYKIYDDVHGV